MPLDLRQPSVHKDLTARHKATLVRGQKGRHRSDLFRVSQFFKRGSADQSGANFGIEQLLELVCVGSTWTENVDANPGASQVLSPTTSQASYGGLGGVVNTHRRRPHGPGGRTCEDDRRTASEKWQHALNRKQSASDVAGQISSGAALEALAETLGATVETSEPFVRDARDPVLGAVLGPLFALAPESGAAVHGRTAGGFVIAVLDAIHEANPADDPVGLRAMDDELASGLADELLIEYQSALERRYPISIEIDTINSLF